MPANTASHLIIMPMTAIRPIHMRARVVSLWAEYQVFIFWNIAVQFSAKLPRFLEKCRFFVKIA